MKRNHLLFLLAGGISILSLASYSSGPAASGVGNRTGSGGATAVANCAGGCHGANNAGTTLTVTLLSGTTVVTSYSPGQTYRVLLSGTSTTTRPKFGFQTSCVKTSDVAAQAGSFATGGNANIAVRTNVSPGPVQVVEHTTSLNGIQVPGTTNVIDTVSFNWTAPVAGTGKVRFYGILNAVNGIGGADAGDWPNTDTLEIAEVASQTSVGNLSRNISVKAFPNPATQVLNIDLSDAAAGAYQFEVFDLAGKKITSQNALAQGTAKVSSLPIGMLQNGWYVLVVSNNGARQAVPFQKL